jgi:adenosylhomocysteine nucleosidase
MAQETIALIAAMPDETQPLLRQVGSPKKEKVGGFPLYRFSVGGRDVALIESGIGMDHAARAAGVLIEAVSPRIILNFGFCGGVTAGPEVGDIVVAERLLFFKGGNCSEQAGLASELARKLAGQLEEGCSRSAFRIHSGAFVTAGEIVEKRSLPALLPAGSANPVLEMETAAVARVAADRGIPLVALRAVSDGADEELGFTIDEFTDNDMNISAWKVLKTIVTRPRIIPQLIRLARNSDRAGKNLAVVVRTALESMPDLAASEP